MQVIWGQVSHMTSPIRYKPFIAYHSLWGYWNCSFCNVCMYMHNIVRAQTHQILLSWITVMSFQLFCIFDFVWRHRWRHTVPLGSSAFLSITSDRNWIEIESRERHHCDSTELPNRLIYNLILNPWSEGVWPDLELILNPGSTLTFTFTKKYIIPLGWMRGLRWSLNCGSAATFGGVMRRSQTPTFGSLTWDLMSSVDQRPQILVPIAVSRSGLHALFSRSSSSIKGKTGRGDLTPPPD